jgi:hypothetical protein
MQLPPMYPPRTRKPYSLNYEPMPTASSIRLLKIHPLESLDTTLDVYRPLRCSIVVKDLQEFPQYDALSYTWGSPLGLSNVKQDLTPSEAWSIQAFDIDCNDQPVSVTRNLYMAMLALRLWHSAQIGRAGMASFSNGKFESLRFDGSDCYFSDFIWIDQLCINQTDILERNSQVKLMAQIYKQAQYVPAWLGDYDDSIKDVWNVSARLYSLGSSNVHKYRSFNIFEDSYGTIGVPDISSNQWLGLYSFLNRSWFQRSWVVQEIALAKQPYFFCTGVVFNFTAIAGICEFLYESGWYIQLINRVEHELSRNVNATSALTTKLDYIPNPLFFRGIIRLRHEIGIQTFPELQTGYDWKPVQLIDLLDRFRTSRATDARDKIYAFIGLFKELARQGLTELTPDYGKSVPEVYIEATTHTITTARNLNCLSYKEDESITSHKSLPSWVPDFDVIAHNPLINGLPPPYSWSADALAGKVHFRFLPDNTLEVRGGRVGRVQSVHRLSRAHITTPKGSTIDLLNVLADEIIQLLRYLPEKSSVTIPADKHAICNGCMHTSCVEQSVETCTSAYQSRFEVLWRTLLHDQCYGKHPAPPSCGEDFLTLMEYAMYAKMTSALSYSRQKDSAVGAHIEWEASRNVVAKDYTNWRKLQGLYSFDAEEVLYPPGFRFLIKELGLHWNRLKSIANRDKIKKLCDLVEYRVEELRILSSRTVAVRNRVLASSMDKTLFVTNQGNLGTSLMSAKRGDEVWVLAGSSVPFLLRPNLDRGYRLIGEAYVHGIMHGEGLKEISANQYLREVSIR